MTATARTRTAILAALVLAVTSLGLMYLSAARASGTTLSRGGASIVVDVQCSTSNTIVREVSHSGGNPGFAARVRQHSGTWNQGPEVSGTGSTSQANLTAREVPASGHGARVYWAASSGGAQTYTFC